MWDRKFTVHQIIFYKIFYKRRVGIIPWMTQNNWNGSGGFESDGIMRFIVCVGDRVWVQAWGRIPGVCAGQSLGQGQWKSLLVTTTAVHCGHHIHTILDKTAHSRSECRPLLWWGRFVDQLRYLRKRWNSIVNFSTHGEYCYIQGFLRYLLLLKITNSFIFCLEQFSIFAG